MMKLAGFLLLVCILVRESKQDEVTYNGHQVWRVVPSSEKVLHDLKELGNIYELDFWNDPVAIGRPVDFRVSPGQAVDIRRILTSRGITEVQVNIPDVQDIIESQRRQSMEVDMKEFERAAARSVMDFDYSDYHNAEEIYAWMDSLVNEFPEKVNKTQIGTTYRGRPIYVLNFTRRASSSPRPIIFIDALIHSREWITTASVLYMLKEMLLNGKYAHMMDDADWYFIPMINVDGYVTTWTEDRLWRRTRSDGASRSCLGVDGNRNWDAHWAYPGASPNPCSSSYYGPTPFSESETRHIAQYVFDFGAGEIDAYVSTHSAGQLILYPYGYTTEVSVHDEVLSTVGKLMSDAIRSVHGKEYIYGPISTTIYPASGSTTDWTYDRAKSILSFTYELRDKGQYGHLLPREEIIPNGQEYLAGIEALKKYVVQNFNSR